MQGLNKIMLVGYIGRNPDIKHTSNGMMITNFSMGVNERCKEGGEWQDKTEWFKIVAFGKTAEYAGKHLAKGSLIYVEGRVQTRTWKGKDGTAKHEQEVICERLISLSQNAGEKPEQENTNDDDDMPF